MQLNPEQKLAVEHFKGPCIVTAVPGSGKTSVLTSRITHLVNHHKVDPRNIVALTFTNKASDTMKERIINNLGADISGKIWISTFHRLCIAILRKNSLKSGIPVDFSIYDDKDQYELLSKICRMNEYMCKDTVIWNLVKAVNDARENVVDMETAFVDYKPIERDILYEYLERLDGLKAVDFSGILYKAYSLLQRAEIAKEISERFQFVLVDETQDTNKLQYEILKMISSHGNIFVVGDLDQSIYRFRGANPENLDLIKKDFTDVSELTLPRNYRSKSEILQYAEKLICHNQGSKETRLIAERGSGGNVRFNAFTNPEDEANRVAYKIHKIKNESNCEWSDFAILYRMNKQSNMPEMALRKYGIPYKVIGGFSFFDRSEIKTSLACLSLAANPHDSVAFARAVSYSGRNIGKTTIGKIEKYCVNNNVSVIDACDHDIDGITAKRKQELSDFAKTFKNIPSDMSLHEKASYIFHNSGFYEFMNKESEKDKDYSKRIENVDELIVGMADFSKKKPGCSISEYLQTIKTITSQDTDADNAVQLMTIHAAKGMEFESVFVIGASNGVIPHYNAQTHEDIQEERRLLYVGITRSKSYLSISYCKEKAAYSSKYKSHYSQKCMPSYFLDEMGLLN
jgi:DNA helicase II / ATP-dependent DNA helicase PcrA